MTDRTWTGAVSNDASNPLNWSPSDSAPEPGDTLTVPGGNTIDIADNALQDDTLTLLRPRVLSFPTTTFNLSHKADATLSLTGQFEEEQATATLNLSQHSNVSLNLFAAQVTANVSGQDTLNVTRSGALEFKSVVTVNLAPHAILFGSFSFDTQSYVVMSGDESTRFHNTGTGLQGTTAIIDTDVVGSGTFDLRTGSRGMDAIPASLEFGGSVSRGQTVTITGSEVFGGNPAAPSSVKIDRPDEFHGTVDLHNLSLADLVGLAQADSWSYKNDLLTLKNACGQVIDKFHILSDASSTGDVHGLSVSKSAAGDVLVSPGADFKGSLALTTS
jgi:hypothetical protein